MSTIIFREADHEYSDLKTGLIIESVSECKKYFVPEFEKRFWLYYKVAQEIMPNFEYYKSKYMCDKPRFKKIIESKCNYDLLISKSVALAKTWKVNLKQAGEYGTKIHKIKENAIIKNGFDRDPDGKLYNHVNKVKYPTKVKHDNYLIGRSVKDFNNGVHLEVVLTYLDILCGTTDKIYVDNSSVIIVDYKTNEYYSTSSHVDSCTGISEKLLYPFDNIDNCHLGEHTIQLNLYAAMLRSYGFNIKSLYVHRCPSPRYNKLIKIEYLPSETNKALSIFLKKSYSIDNVL